jgi:hypothetical protein
MNMHVSSANGSSILTFPKGRGSNVLRGKRFEICQNDNRETPGVAVVDAWYHQAAIEDEKSH